MSENKKIRRHPVLRGILIAVLVVVIAAGGFFGGFAAYLTATEYKPSPIEKLSVIGSGGHSSSDEIKVMTWNIGYGALGETADFFMDGGSHVSTATRKGVKQNLYGITKAIREADPDVVFLQEADTDSTRSHHVNERTFIENNTKNYCNTFAYNYRVRWIPVPIPPLGKMNAGIMTLSKLQINDSERIALPCPFSWPLRLGNLKRCISINRASVKGGSDNLSLVNLHLEAYDSGEGKKAQTKLLRQYLDMEYDDGNYVIAGGDFNQSFSDIDTSMYPTLEGRWHCGKLNCDEFADHWQFAMDTSTPSCRSLDQSYKAAASHDPDKFQYYMIDGFIISDNLEIENVETLDLGFKNTDHNPVVITLRMK
ncbi:MAG: endonuclease [Lachnospiraceae bacterium]|nr:endonuclease [Lachnospiraceae bacterium]